MDDGEPQPSVIEAYAKQFRAGMIDLSAPSPTPLPLSITPGALADADLAFTLPGGSRALREAVAARYESLAAEDVLITCGGSEALAALAGALAGPGRRIGVLPGAYASFVEVARATGADLVPWQDAKRADVVIATNPSVPDGRRLDVPRLLAEADRAGAVAIVDEVYRSIVLTGSIPVAAADLDARAVSVGDLTKPLGLGGLRIGWIATRNVEVREAAARWLGLITGGPSTLSEAAALHALDGFDAAVSLHAAEARANAPRIYGALDDAGWTFEEAELGLTVCARPPRPLGPGAWAALAEAGMFAVPGEAFGQPGCLRIGLLTPVQRLRSALALLGEASRGDTLVVLARVPHPGTGKTRLAVDLGVTGTHLLSHAFVQDTARLAAAGPWHLMAAFTPAHASSEARALFPSALIVPQVEGDMGERLLGALDAALEHGDRAVLIGSDTPDLPPRLIEAAFAALHHSDLVLAPAEDGGFVLIGVRETDEALFTDVEWSTARVCAQVIARAQALGWRVTTLDAWQDVDDLESLRALTRRIVRTGQAPATLAAVQALGLASQSGPGERLGARPLGASR